MQETPETLLEETSELLDALAPVVQRNIDALQHNPNPLLQHLIQQEIERQDSLLQRVEEMRERLNGYLNPREEVPQPGDVPQQDEVVDDLQQDEPESDSQLEDSEQEGFEPDEPQQEELEDDLQREDSEPDEPEYDFQLEDNFKYLDMSSGSSFRDMKEIRLQGYPSVGGGLGVTMPHGEQIRRQYVVQTYVEVIEKIGIEKIKSLNLRYGKNSSHRRC